MKNKSVLFVFFLTLIAIIFHFYNLNWGAPFYFHPDERNIAASVSQIQFPRELHPHFFAYGALPIYTIYFTGSVLNLFQTTQVTFEQAILISRFYSALFATLLVPLLFLIGKKLHGTMTGLIASGLTTLSVGFIQFAHFGTFEMWLTFFTVVLFWIYLSLPNLPQKIAVLLFGGITGILISVKVSHLALLPIVLLILLFYDLHRNKKHVFLYKILSLLQVFFLFFFTAFLIYYLTNPFVFFDTNAFRDSMRYESSLALGKLPVFYTGEFLNTIPVVFQFLHVYPFLLNPLVTFLFIPACIAVVAVTVKKKNTPNTFLIIFLLTLLLSQAFFYVKWVRYMVPTLPFIYLIIALFFSYIGQSKLKPINYVLLPTTFVVCFVFALSYFITALVKEDTRVQAYQFARHSIPSDASIVSEVYDMGIVPFNESFRKIYLFHFYDLDNNSPVITTSFLQQTLAQNDYIILPSQRILKTRLLKKEQFPNGHAFYQGLITNRLGYTKIYETPCDIFCKITYLNDPIYSFEQTANVFDRPTVMIFKKQ